MWGCTYIKGCSDKEGDLLLIGLGVSEPPIRVHNKKLSAPVKGGIKRNDHIYLYILTLPVFSMF